MQNKAERCFALSVMEKMVGPVCNDETATQLALEVLDRGWHVLVHIVERPQEVVERFTNLKRDRALRLVIDLHLVERDAFPLKRIQSTTQVVKPCRAQVRSHAVT